MTGRARQAQGLLFYHKAVAVFVFPTVETEIDVYCEHLDWQVSSLTQIFNVLSPLFSDVVDLTLDYRDHTLSSELHNQVDRAQWRELLGSFRNMKTLRVHNGLVSDLSRSLQLDGNPPLELLPELTELICAVGSVDIFGICPRTRSCLPACQTHRRELSRSVALDIRSFLNWRLLYRSRPTLTASCKPRRVVRLRPTARTGV
jgi:hypothetical protein